MVDYNDERSPLWALGAVGALGTGIGVGVHQNWAALRSAVTAPLPGQAVESVIGYAAKAQAFNTAPRVATTILEENLKNALTHVDPALLRSDLLHAGYAGLMAGSRLTSNKAISSLEQGLASGGNLDLYNNLLNIVAKEKGDVNAFQRSLADLYVGKTRVADANLIASPGSFDATTKLMELADLTPEARAEYNVISGKIGTAMSRFPNAEGAVYSLTGTPSDPVVKLKLAGTEFALPLNRGASTMVAGPGVTYSLSGAYTHGRTNMTFNEYALASIQDAIENSQTSTQLKNNLYEANQNMISAMRIRDSEHFKAARWTLPSWANVSGGEAINRLDAYRRVAYGLKHPGDLIEEGIQFGNGLWPHFSPSSVAKGTLASQDLAFGLYGDLGLLMDPAHRPTVGIRGNWGLTQGAKDVAARSTFWGSFGQYYNRLERADALKGPLYNQIMHGEHAVTSAKAYSNPQLVTFYAREAAGEGVGYEASALRELLSAEEGVMSERASEFMQRETAFTRDIALDPGLNVHSTIAQELKGAKIGQAVPFSLGEGAMLGIEADTGRAIGLESGRGWKQEVIGAELIDANRAKLYFKQTHNLTSGEMWKMFSEEQKSLLGVKTQKEFEHLLKASGLAGNAFSGQKIEAIMPAKHLIRNKTALITQQIEAMSMVIGKKLDKKAGINTAEALNFLANPLGAANVRQILDTTDVNAHVQIQKNLVGLAQTFGFNTAQMQYTFGYADEAALANLAPGLQKSIMASPGVIGLSKAALGDMVSGDWGRGSMEQAMFRNLVMQGPEGREFAGDIARRIIGKGALAPMTKMEESMSGVQLRHAFSSLEDITEGELIRPEGRHVRVGKSLNAFSGSNTLYIPGTNEAEELLRPIRSNNKVIESPLVQDLMHFKSMANRYAKAEKLDIDKAVALNEMEAAGQALRKTVAMNAEAQAAPRGKVIGSKIMTTLRRAEGNVHLFNRQDIIAMHKDMMERASVGEQAEIQTMLDRWLAGETGVLASARYPGTSSESMQFIHGRIADEMAPGTVGVPRQMAQLTINGKTSTVDVSSIVGQHGDFDRDQLHIFAMNNRDLNNRLAKKVAYQQSEQYNQYLFTQYSLSQKFKETLGTQEVLTMNNAKSLAAGYRKLTAAKVATGPVNLTLQRFKMGLAYHSTDPAKYQGLANVMWHLEEAAISGKHGVLQSDLYTAISKAGEVRGAKGTAMMEDVLRSVFGGDINVSGEFVNAAGETIKPSPFKLSLKDAARELMQGYEADASEIDALMRASRMSKNKNVFVSNSDLIEQHFIRKYGSLDPAQAAMSAAYGGENLEGIVAKAERGAKRIGSKRAAIADILKKGKKPMLIGAAAAAGLMLMAPSTSGALRPNTTINAGRGLKEDDIVVPSGEGVPVPPPRPNLSPRIYTDSGANEAVRANINMHINDLDNADGFVRNINRLGGHTSVRYRDDRRVTDPRQLASRISERL